MIIIIVALLVLIGGGVGGMYFFGIDPLVKLGISAPAVHQDEPPPPPLPPSYVEFGVLIIPVIQDREVKKQAEMIVRLQVEPKNKEIVAKNLPRLQNAFLGDMIGFLSVTVREGQPLDVVAIQNRLLMTGDKTLGAGFLKDVVVENPVLK
ncbi:flagellar basal body-associated protein FliL [Paramagnetospirillum kuznetsovii]|uniref:Flagellar basal body-associated protein FliL n=1 Tax=Paramagnetospirillum kuznetsovii TaxID=2053833 RepID=A0A364P0N0_9PROT|nr:flagellar basal body-associated protein FliL [Paramagnetospirillum kuznetsovii]